jgi:hypothetical protein
MQRARSLAARDEKHRKAGAIHAVGPNLVGHTRMDERVQDASRCD